MSAPQSIQLENRSCTVTVGTVQIQNIGLQTGLDVWFSVRRSLRPKEPNTCDLRLYGLGPASRAAIASSSVGSVSAVLTKGTSKTPSKVKASSSAIVPVVIQAGYVGGTSTIFHGQMRSAQTVRDGPDLVVELTTGDGDGAALLSRSTTSFGTGTTAYAVAQSLLSDMGIGVGNIATVTNILKASPLYKYAVVLKGNSMDHLVDLAASCGLEVSVQHGVAQWLSLGQPLSGQAYELNAKTGLIGSPSVDTKGVLTATTLMLPGIDPGKPIMLDAQEVQGLFRIVNVETTGDTKGNDWYHALECKPYLAGI